MNDPNVCGTILRCAGLLAAKLRRDAPLQGAKWAVSRRVGSPPKRTCWRLPIFLANGLTAFMPGVHHAASCSTWISSVSPTHGEQENRVWNGHCGCACYRPLFLFNQFGDLECALRPATFTKPADGRRC